MLKHTFFSQSEEEKTDQSIVFNNEEVAELELAPYELPIDLIQTSGHLIVRCPIAGAGIHDIDISLNTDTLTIQKHGEVEDPPKILNMHNQECYWGELTRTIELPKPVDADHTRASLENGILVITMPIIARANIRTIKVQS